MTFDEARSEAVQGARVTSPSIGESWFVDYQFNGWQINSPNGSHSGFSWTEKDKAAEWRIVEDEPQPVANKWGLSLPRIELGEHGVPAKAWGAGLKHAEDAYADLTDKPRRMARPPSNVGTPAPKLSGFELAQLAAKQEEPPKVDKWGEAAKPKPSVGKWGPGT